VRVATVRSIIALMVVGIFMLITGFMALFPLLASTNVQLNTYADFFAKTSSVYTGIVGVIVGYYFGRTLDGKSPAGQPPPPEPSPPAAPPDRSPGTEGPP
jgi:uncharacterized membrane protein HdeD (DUF308 family)